MSNLKLIIEFKTLFSILVISSEYLNVIVISVVSFGCRTSPEDIPYMLDIIFLLSYPCSVEYTASL